MGGSSLQVSTPGRAPHLSGMMLGMASNSRPDMVLIFHLPAQHRGGHHTVPLTLQARAPPH